MHAVYSLPCLLLHKKIEAARRNEPRNETTSYYSKKGTAGAAAGYNYRLADRAAYTYVP